MIPAPHILRGLGGTVKDVSEKQGWIVNPILFIIVAGLSVLFVAALLYQLLIVR